MGVHVRIPTTLTYLHRHMHTHARTHARNGHTTRAPKLVGQKDMTDSIRVSVCVSASAGRCGVQFTGLRGVAWPAP